MIYCLTKFNGIFLISYYQLDTTKAAGYDIIYYLLDSDLSVGWHYSSTEQQPVPRIVQEWFYKKDGGTRRKFSEEPQRGIPRSCFVGVT